MNLLVPLLVVLAVTYICGSAARRVGQARVIGEMLGGILLGPTLFGRIAPAAWRALFTPASLTSFEALSTLGLVLYLFLIGTEMDATHLSHQRRAAAWAAAASLLLPFALALFVAPAASATFGVGSGGRIAFTLFLGIALSITAFPVLARILEERGLSSTALGITALLCAAADDVVAWMLLAVAMTFLPQGASSIAQRIAWFAAYLVVMFIVSRAARAVAARHASRPMPFSMMAVVVLGVLASAAVTDALGLHPLFGAFVAGLCFPRIPAWQQAIRQRLELPVTAILLPLFFALTGLRTRLDLLQGGMVMRWFVLILLLAVVGKVGGGMLAGRIAGDTWRNAFALGALLNTRGLVELIVLNIALMQGVFSPALFTVMVAMALVTTMMTSPLLNLLRIGMRTSLR